MPLRARGVLETLDLTIKVFRRYFRVLLAWSALSIGVCTLVALFGVASAGVALFNPSNPYPYSGFSTAAMMSLMLSSLGACALAFFCYPLMVGASACCVAGAVRGQNIKFAQCWSFSRPRYWSMLGQTFLAFLVMWIAFIGAAIAFGLVIALGVFVVSSLPGFAAGFLGIIGAIVLYAAFFVVMMMVGLWLVLVPVVVCMEENNRNSNALGRALSLLRGNWRRAAGLMLIVWIGFALAGAIFQMPLALMGTSDGSSGGLLLGGAFLMQMLFYLAGVPFYTLLISLFYIDARVRNEALDLEWSSHAGTPHDETTNGTPLNTSATNGQPSFYPPVAHATAATDSANIARPDVSVWNASPEQLASMPLEAFTPQRVAPTETPATPTFDERGYNIAQTPSPQTLSPQTQPSQTQPFQMQPLQMGETSPPAFAAPAEPQQPQSSTRFGDESATAATSATGFALDNSAAVAPPTTAPSSVASSNAAPSNAAILNEAATLSADATATRATVKCPQCEAEVAASQTFCMNCGHRMTRRDDATGFGA